MKKKSSKTFFALGTVNSIMIPGYENEAGLCFALQRVRALDEKLSVFKESSEISQINAAAGRHFVQVAPDTLQVVKSALKFSVISEGSGECIDCFACVEACPRGNVTANPVPTMAAAAAVITITGLYYAGNLVSQNNVAEATTPDMVIADSAYTTGQYTDGVYLGSAAGYKGTTEVEVTVENGNITGLDVVAIDDDPYFNLAESSTISRIIESQSVDVATVSGATYSSAGIIEAMADVLGLEYANIADATEKESTSGHRGGSSN